jgi:hypothetical protein
MNRSHTNGRLKRGLLTGLTPAWLGFGSPG